MEKNNLDNLFKDKLKDFSEIPDPKVWDRVSASLDKKKKKRVIPLWWQFGGVAALIAVVLFITDPFSKNEAPNLPNVVDTEEKTDDILPQNSNNGAETTVDQEPQIVDSNIPENDLKKDQSPPPTAKEKTGMVPNSNTKPKSQLASLGKPPFTTKNGEGNERDNNPSPAAVQEQEAIAGNTSNQNLKKDKEELNQGILDFTKEEEAVAQNEEDASSQKSIYEAIAEQEELQKDAMAKNNNRWSVGPSVAPVYFNALGEGSPIHSNFAANSKSGKLNLSYGLTVAYNISDRLSIRSGVHRVDYGYDTNDILFSSSAAAANELQIDNISYSQTSRSVVVESKNSETAALSDIPEVRGELSPLEGRMVQQLGYVEVPMEVNYALLDKKFGINLIGGISSLFLVDNAVSLESNDMVTEIGEANNANDVNFSTNVGIGLQYKLSPKVRLNLEPMFKYQLNTFSDTAGEFRPYSVGVYSGLRFKF